MHGPSWFVQPLPRLHDQLLHLAWNDPSGIGPDRVKFTVMRLRRKLGQLPSQATSIEAIRGFGYRYLPPSE